MRAAINDSLSYSNPRNGQRGVDIQFVDKDKLPLGHVIEHCVSENEFYLDKSGSSQEDSYEPTTDEGTDEEMEDDVEEEGLSEVINCREDVEFQEEVGITVDSDNL